MSLFDAGFMERPKIEVKLHPWMKKVKMELVTTGARMREVIDECLAKPYYALDLETTGLDTRVFPRETPEGTEYKTNCDIVGLCLSPSAKVGYYIPVRHCPDDEPSEHNVPFHEFDAQVRRLMEAMKVKGEGRSIPIVFNCKFEGEVMTYNGGPAYGTWDEPDTWEDVLILSYLDDSTRRAKTLKVMSDQLLGKKQIELKELFPPKTKNLNFANLDPTAQGVLEYAAADAICTLQLYDKLKTRALALTSKIRGTERPHSQGFVYKVEKLCLPSVRWMERNRLHIDLAKVAELIQLGQHDLYKSLKEVYQGASDILQRDIAPLSFYLMSLYIEATNPTMAVTGDTGETFQAMVDRFRAETKKLQKRYDRQDLGVLKMCETGEVSVANHSGEGPLRITLKAPKFGELIAREAPPPRKGVELRASYDVLAPAQLGTLMWDLAVPGLKKTPSGQVATGKEVLEEVIENSVHDYPFVKRIKWMRGNQNALGKLYAIFEDTYRHDNTLKIGFRQFATATGRFSSKGEREPWKTGGTRFNLQSMPATYDTKRPPALLRIRECIVAPKGWTMVAIDFGGVELRLAANLSNEKKWIDAFFRCSACDLEFDRGDGKTTPPAPPIFCPRCGEDKIGDIHTLTAIQIFGEAAQKRKDWKELRKQGKSANFALSYGGGPKAIHRNTGCGENEAYRIGKSFKKAYTDLQNWWTATRKFAKKHEYVLTAFQRKFPLADIKHEERFIRAKAERNAVNSPIQGSSADITKLAMGLIYKEVRKRKWQDKVRMVITMHDELVFEIRNDVLEEACDLFADLMVSNKAVLGRRWPVPLTVDVELGPNWTVKHNLTAIRYAVALRREMQQPGLDNNQIRALLRRIKGFYGDPEDVKAKFGSFEEIKWPPTLEPHFESGRYDRENPMTAEDKAALAKAWDMFHSGDLSVDARVDGQPAQNIRVIPYRLAKVDEEEGERLAQAIVESHDPEGFRLELFSPTGEALDDWFPEPITVDRARFVELMGG